MRREVGGSRSQQQDREFPGVGGSEGVSRETYELGAVYGRPMSVISSIANSRYDCPSTTSARKVEWMVIFPQLALPVAQVIDCRPGEFSRLVVSGTRLPSASMVRPWARWFWRNRSVSDRLSQSIRSTIIGCEKLSRISRVCSAASSSSQFTWYSDPSPLIRLSQTYGPRPGCVQVTDSTWIGAFSTTWGSVVVVEVGTVVEVAVPSLPKRFTASATRMTTSRRPLMASAARTPAVAWTAGRGAVGSGSWRSRAPQFWQWRLVEGFGA